MSAGLTKHGLYGQTDDMLNGGLPLKETNNLALDSNAPPWCFCPVDACNCPGQIGRGQEQEYCVPPAAFQLKMPADT